MAFGSENSSALSLGAQRFYSGVTHDSFYSGSHALLEVDFPAGSSDLTVIQQTSAGNADTDSWSTQAFQLSASTDADPTAVDFSIQGVRRWRIGGDTGGSSSDTVSTILHWRID